MPSDLPESVAGVIDVTRFGGNGPADLVIEVPHGATATADYERVARSLHSPLPENLVDFFHVNTDAGAPELAAAVAEGVVNAHPGRRVSVLRSRIPRTFIDCNRVIDAPAEAFREGRVTPGLMPWVTAASDRQWLRAQYDAYVDAVRAELDAALPGAAMLLLHTYAPRTVGVEVDERIVESLHRAYAPDVVPTWPLRPEVDVIGTDVNGVSHAPEAVVAVLRRGYDAIGVQVGDSATYPLHPSTLAHSHAMRRLGRVLCVEVRRDQVADPFEPFAQMRISPSAVAKMAAPLSQAVGGWL